MAHRLSAVPKGRLATDPARDASRIDVGGYLQPAITAPREALRGSGRDEVWSVVP
jgi:hypothetical protein